MADESGPAIEAGGAGKATDTASPAQDKRARKDKPTAPKMTQAAPTAPRTIDRKSGLELDEHGLPLSGPARRRWLRDANIEDPALNRRAGEQEKADG